jgi:hypothetical protein
MNHLPPNLNKLLIGYNEMSFEYIPQGYKFNGTLHNLPLSLNKLMVTSAPFNQPLKLPPKLHILKIASETYNNELNLPTQLQVLEFRSDVFNKEIMLPLSLHTFGLCAFCFNYPLNNMNGKIKNLKLKYCTILSHPITNFNALESVEIYVCNKLPLDDKIKAMMG